MTKIQITKSGFATLSQELASLKSKRDLLINGIEETSQPDEGGENPVAVQLKEELELVLAKIADLEEGLLNSEVITGSKSYSKVEIGSKVKIKLAGKAEKEFHIVSHFESNPAESKISDQSPLGLALLGKKVDDEVEFAAPVGLIKYKIVAIH